jgi:hypothetical protein
VVNWFEPSWEDREDLWVFGRVAFGHPFASMSHPVWNTFLIVAGSTGIRGEPEPLAQTLRRISAD